MEKRYEGRPELVKPLVVSLLIPVAGGLYEYFKHRGSEPQISKIFLLGAFSLPVWSVINQLLSAANVSNYWLSLALMTSLVFLLKKALLKDNKYADILWIYYMFVIGAIYSYYFKYRGNHELRYLIYHSVVQTLAYAIIIGLLLGTASIFALAIFGSAMPIIAL